MDPFSFLADEHLLSAEGSAFQVSLDPPSCLHILKRQRMIEIKLILIHIELQLSITAVPILYVPIS